jgi:outer membrane receptor for ferrienterochelin and colicin
MAEVILYRIFVGGLSVKRVFKKGGEVMKRIFGLLVVSIISFAGNSFAAVPVVSPATPAVATAAGEEELLFMDIPQVVTASKSVQTVQSAPSAMTVWTAADIKMMGLSSIREVLQRTVGFFPNTQYAATVLGARGFISDTNVAYLYLVDGHNINNITQYGGGEYYLLPALDKVKQIEIVRGPGSTLWGSDAALAIINIITKDGKDVNGFQTSVAYASATQQKTFNALYGKSVGPDTDALVSFTLTHEYGYPRKADGTNPDVHPYDYLSKGYYNSWGGTSGRQTGPFFAMGDSWEVYAKEKIQNLTISAMMTNIVGPDLWQLSGDHKKMFSTSDRKTFIDAKHTLEINDSTSLETRAYADFQVVNPHKYNPQLGDNQIDSFEDNQSKTQGGGLDEMLIKKFQDFDTVKVGLHYVQTTIDPIFSYYNLTTTAGTVTGKVIPRNNDREMAGFIENEWKIIDKLAFIAGVRVDNDTLRDRTTSYLPRAALIYDMTERWTLKYMFNTGNVRPPVLDSYLGGTPPSYDLTSHVTWYNIGAKNSERILDNEIQALYKQENIDFSATVYQMQLNNYFNYVGAYLTNDGTETGKITSPDGLLYRLTTVNANTITSKGIELDTRSKLTEKASWYANYAYVFSSKVNNFSYTVDNYTTSFLNGAIFDNNRNMCAYPRQIWNLGLNFLLHKDMTLNLNYRGWSMMRTLADSTVSPTLYTNLSPSAVIDTAFVYDSIGGTGWGASLAIKNLLNAKNKIALQAGGYYLDVSRSVNAKVSYKF